MSCSFNTGDRGEGCGEYTGTGKNTFKVKLIGKDIVM